MSIAQYMFTLKAKCPKMKHEKCNRIFYNASFKNCIFAQKGGMDFLNGT